MDKLEDMNAEHKITIMDFMVPLKKLLHLEFCSAVWCILTSIIMAVLTESFVSWVRCLGLTL